MLGKGVHDGQCGVDRQPAGRDQLILHNGHQWLPVTADHPGLAQRGGALAEAGRVDPLGSARVFDPQVVVELKLGSPVQHHR
jgi:hypothetical protein